MADPAQQDPDDEPEQSAARLRDEVVNTSYDVAFEPERLTDLIGPWEKLFVPQWRRSAQARRAQLEDSGYLSHLGRLERIVSLGGRTASLRPEEQMVRRYRRAAAFTVDRSLAVSAANEAARGTLGVRRSQPLTDLQIRDEDLGYLSRTVHGMLHADRSAPPEPTRIVRARRLSDDSLVLLLTFLVEPEEAAAFVLVTTTDIHWSHESSALLRDAFGLTPAEAEVMMALTQHHSLKDIAEARGRSLDTVRSQLKSITTKTEARGQSDLLRIAMSVMDIAPQEVDRIGPASRGAGHKVSRGGRELPPLPFRHILRPDGRRFDYLEFGDPKGRPVIYLSSNFGLCRWPASAEFASQQKGLRIIAPIRSGFGGSTPLAVTDNRLDCFAGDVVALMDHLRIPAAPFLVLDEDMVYAARLFRRTPERMHSVLGCSAFLPLTTPEQYERMGRWHRFILGTARFAPQLLPFIVRVGFAMARQLGKAEFVRLVYGASPADVALTRHSRMFEAVDCGSDIVLAEGFDAARAYAQEISIVHRSDWRAEFEAMKGHVNVVNVIGTEDQGIPPDTFDDYLRDYPWVQLHQVDSAGSFLFFEHWDRIISLLEIQMKDVT